MVSLPDTLRGEVIGELVRQFDSMRWEELSNPERTLAYTRLVKDARVGGRMRAFMAEGDIRVWIKDGPAKEYRRALEGVGPLAPYTGRAYPGPDAIVKAALGQSWSPRSGSVEEKPMRCFAVDGSGQSIFVIWGTIASLKDLVWHAAVTRAKEPSESITLAIAKPTNAPLEGENWKLALKLARMIEAECKQVTYAVGMKSSADIGFERRLSVTLE